MNVRPRIYSGAHFDRRGSERHGDCRKQQRDSPPDVAAGKERSQRMTTDFASLLEALHTEGPSRHRAARTLQEELRDRARRLLSRRHPTEERLEDLVADLLFKLLNQPDAFRGKHWGYVHKAIVNEASTSWKRGRWEQAAEEGLFERQAAPQRADPREVEQRWLLLDRAHAHAVESRRKQDRAALEESWPQLKGLLEGRWEFQELVDAEVAAKAAAQPPMRADPQQVQNRLYQAHKRCREALLRALKAIEAERQWADEDLTLARQQVAGLLRAAGAPPTGT